jgi:hypothetical protein
VRLRSGSWWFEVGLESLPANVSGQLRIGFMSDSLTDSEAAGFSLELGPSKRQGRVEQLEWASGLKGGVKQQTKLVCNSKHRIAISLSFPQSEAGETQRVPSWIKPGGHFDEIEIGQRVVVADTELCEELFANAGVPWTEMHNYYCGRTGRARTGVVHRLPEPVKGGGGKEHITTCYVKLDTGAAEAAPSLSPRDAAVEEKGVLSFLPGCLLDAPERQFKSRSRESGCLSLYMREGDASTTVKQGHHPIYTLPGDLPLRPFVEWISADSAQKEGVTLLVHFYAADFALRENAHFLPMASDEMMKEQRADNSVVAKLAAEYIKKTLVRKVQRKFVLYPTQRLNPMTNRQFLIAALWPRLAGTCIARCSCARLRRDSKHRSTRTRYSRTFSSSARTR